MKKKNISEILGTTQQEAALLLGVHRSQLSMYASGKRDLPTAALLRLAELTTQLQEQRAGDDAPLRAERRHQLEQRLQENHYQQLKVKRILDRRNKASGRQERAAVLSEKLQGQTDNDKQPIINTVVHALAAKASVTGSQLPALVGYQIKFELLVQEQKALEQMLDNTPEKP